MINSHFNNELYNLLVENVGWDSSCSHDSLPQVCVGVVFPWGPLDFTAQWMGPETFHSKKSTGGTNMGNHGPRSQIKYAQ